MSSNYRGFDVWELPPNGQGIAALQILNILEQYDITNMGHNSAEYIHLFTEAKKLAYEDRAKYYADMNFANVPVKELISKEEMMEAHQDRIDKLFLKFDKNGDNKLSKKELAAVREEMKKKIKKVRNEGE